jgi:hypothetical protein
MGSLDVLQWTRVPKKLFRSETSVHEDVTGAARSEPASPAAPGLNPTIVESCVAELIAQVLAEAPIICSLSSRTYCPSGPPTAQPMECSWWATRQGRPT